MFLAVEPAPAGLWEKVMTTVQTAKTTATPADIWRSIALEVSAQGIQRLVLRDAAQADAALSHAGTRAADLWE